MNKLVTSKIQSHLNDPTMTIDVEDTVTSTNDYLLTKNQQKSQIQICVAEQQTYGRGRLNKTWHSPTGCNIYLSLAVDIDISPNSLSGISLTMALASCAAIEKNIALPGPLYVKWPNDIWYGNKKLGGLLLETAGSTNQHGRLIIGAGINVNMTYVQDNAIDQDWTSLSLITHSLHDRNTLCASLINTWRQYLTFYQQSGLTPFISEWDKRDILRGKKVQLQQGHQIFEGIMQGITDQGFLKIVLADNTRKIFSSGDVRLLSISSNN